MHYIEPHYNWRAYYVASEDQLSPFYGNEYSEFEFSNAIYNYYIHPQWDNMGSATLYLKILYVNYGLGFCIIELLGEWNDCLYNDIMYLKRNIVDSLAENRIDKFILLCDNVLNFHYSDTDYYEEWFDDIGDGWVAAINLREHVLQEFENGRIDQYMAMGGPLNDMEWRNLSPTQVFGKISKLVNKWLLTE
ncbi:MAG: hypothetical protein JXA03_00660 [Bacteroidales bacterium]|nr:hypothetical protein [Bacteroidales bacterium]